MAYYCFGVAIGILIGWILAMLVLQMMGCIRSGDEQAKYLAARAVIKESQKQCKVCRCIPCICGQTTW